MPKRIVKKIVEKIKEVIHMGENPRDIALAVALGVFFAFFPILGVHTIMAVGLAWIFGLNPGIALVASFINNPWTIAFLYGGSLWVGLFVMNMDMAQVNNIDWTNMNMDALIEAVKAVAAPFIVGCLLVGSVAGVMAYFISHKAILTYLARSKKAGEKMEEPG